MVRGGLFIQEGEDVAFEVRIDVDEVATLQKHARLEPYATRVKFE
jgi:hypothetical protein